MHGHRDSLIPPTPNCHSIFGKLPTTSCINHIFKRHKSSVNRQETVTFVQQLRSKNAPRVKNPLFLRAQGLAQFSGLARAQNSGTIRATRPQGRGTLRREADSRPWNGRPGAQPPGGCVLGFPSRGHRAWGPQRIIPRWGTPPTRILSRLRSLLGYTLLSLSFVSFGNGDFGCSPKSRPGARSTGAAGANRAKQSQFARTRQRGQVPSGKRVMANWICKSPRQNKANLHRSFKVNGQE